MASSSFHRYLVAERDLCESEVIIQQSPLVIGPIAEDENAPVCLNCYLPLEMETSFRYEQPDLSQYLKMTLNFLIFMFRHFQRQMSEMWISTVFCPMRRQRSYRYWVSVSKRTKCSSIFELAIAQIGVAAWLRSNHNSEVSFSILRFLVWS